jgi:hypothetical protein
MHRKYANPAGLDANHIVVGYVKRAWSGRDAFGGDDSQERLGLDM